MIRLFVDTNCYILYVQNNLPRFKDVLELRENGKIKIFYQSNLREELLKKPSIPQKEKLDFKRLLKPLDYRGMPFTLGVSRLGSSDYLSRYSNRKEKSNDVTIQEVREGILKAMFLTKKRLGDSDKEDLRLYSEAVNLGCEYFITQNTRDFGRAETKKRRRIENFDKRVKPICKIRTVDEFLREIKEEIIGEGGE